MNETTDGNGNYENSAEHSDATETGSPLILVVGASGKTGRRVAERLEASGAAVRRGSRSGQPAFDWTEPGTWASALEGVTRVYVSYFPDLAMPGAPEAIGAFIAEARRAGVRRVVLLSGRGEAEAQRAEEVVAESGLEWTVVRCSFFAQNFSEGVFLGSVLAGEVALPVGDVEEPFVDVEDVAEVAVYMQIPTEAFTASLTEVGKDPDVVEMLAYLFTEVLDGRNQMLTDGVQRALGRPPKDFSAYATETAASGIWSN